MKFDAYREARRFLVGRGKVEISHVADIYLQPDEMVTFVAPAGHEYDVVAKDWGFYATPSIGHRLRRFEMRAALMRNSETQHLFVVLVFQNRIPLWQEYMSREGQELVMWLDQVQST